MPTWPLFRGFWSCWLWSVQRNWSCRKNAHFSLCFSYSRCRNFRFNETLSTGFHVYKQHYIDLPGTESHRFVDCLKRFPDWHQKLALEEFTTIFVPPRNVQLADGLRFLALRNVMGVQLDEWVRALELLSVADFNSMWLNLSALLCRCLCKGREKMHTYYETINVSVDVRLCKCAQAVL